MKDITRKGEHEFLIEKRVFLKQHNHKEKVFVFERLRRMKMKGKIDNKQLGEGDVEYRIGYYIVGKNGNRKGKWIWGQFCPLIPLEDFENLIKAARDNGIIIK